jgi:2'-5' RNA ligase
VKSADADKPPRKNASTQINITGEAAYRMKQVASKFPKDELAGDGIEDHPHITVKFGVQEDGEALAKVAREFEPFDITFGKLHAFEPSESSDGAAPIVVLIESPELLKLNAAVKAAISNREDDFEYKPHATLAYVRPDVVDKYEGSALFEGMEFRVGAITLSGKDRAQTNIALGSGKAVTAAVRNREHSLTMGAEIEGFPPVVVIRWPQKGMRWRTVLTIVKQIAGDVAGRRVPWRAIHVFESPWGSKIEQDEQWEDWSAKKKFIMYDILEDGAFVSVGKPSAAQRKEAAQPGVAVYRGETPGGQPAGFAATFVSESPDSAAQYGAVRRLALDPDAEFLDMDSPEAHRLVEEFRGEKLSKEDFDDLAPEHFMFPDEAWREFLTGKGYNGTRMGKDLAVFDAGMLKAGSHKETPLEDTVYPHFEMDDAGQETQAYANLPDRVDGATAVPSLEELVPGRFEKKADTDSEPVSAPAFAYHVTQREYLGSIASKGLLPRPAEQVEGVTGNVLFFQADQPYASAPGLQDEVEIVLKAKLPQVPAFQDTDNPGRPSFYIRASVPPANLWVVEKGRETPLLRYTQQMVTASAQWDKVREYKNGKIEFHKGGIFIEVVPHKPPSGVKITLRDSSREGRGGVRPYMHYINYPKKYEGYEPPKGKTWEDIGLVWPPDERCIMVPEAEWSKPGYTAFDTITREQKEQAAEKELQSYLAVISRLKQGSVTASDFKAWFRGSKVVDEKGQPLLVYHGTTNLGFTEFEQRPGTISTVFGPEHVQRTGFFFTPEKSFAEEFTGVDNGAGYSREGRVMPVYLSIKNPADFSNGISDKLLDQLTKAGMNDRWLLYAGEQWEMFDGEDGAMLVSKLKQLGYDGAIIVEPDENRKETLSYIAFSPSQIRPATKTAAYAEAQNQVQHTRHDNVSISKTPKDDPFAEERSEPGQAKEAAYGDTEPPYFWFEPGFDPKAKEFIMGNRNCDDETLCCQDEASCWEGKLKTAGFDARLIYGEFGKDREGHWWVEVGGKIFDPTAAQFRLYEDESLRQQPDRGLYITAKGKTVGEAYLLHFNIPAGASIAPTREDANKDFHARHYLGWAEDATARIKSHYEGTSGVKIIDAIHRKNITFTVARTWGGVTRKFERRLKDQGGLSRHCPICKQQGLIPASRYRGKAVENAQVAPEAQGSGPDFVESD